MWHESTIVDRKMGLWLNDGTIIIMHANTSSAVALYDAAIGRRYKTGNLTHCASPRAALNHKEYHRNMNSFQFVKMHVDNSKYNLCSERLVIYDAAEAWSHLRIAGDLCCQRRQISSCESCSILVFYITYHMFSHNLWCNLHRSLHRH